MFAKNPNFNLNNFYLSIDLIQYTLDLYKESLNTPINIPFFQQKMMKNFGLEKACVFETFSSSPKNSIQSIIAIGGIIIGTNIAVISFRGTSNNPEWFRDFQSMRVIHIPTNDVKNEIGQVEPLSGISKSFPNILIGEGFYNIYASRIGYRDLSSGCVCKTNCFMRRCQTFETSYYSQIEKKCTQKNIKCSSTSLPSLQTQIYQYMITNKCTQVLITGHSLGAALTNLCVFHLQHAFSSSFIHSVYSFASPRTGNPDFAENFRNIQNYYTIINSNDLITNIPLPYQKNCFSHVGEILLFVDLNTDIECNSDYIWTMHSLDTYKSHAYSIFEQSKCARESGLCPPSCFTNF